MIEFVLSLGTSFSAIIKFSSFIWCLGPRQCGQCGGILNIKQGRGWGYYSDWNMTYLT